MISPLQVESARWQYIQPSKLYFKYIYRWKLYKKKTEFTFFACKEQLW